MTNQEFIGLMLEKHKAEDVLEAVTEWLDWHDFKAPTEPMQDYVWAALEYNKVPKDDLTEMATGHPAN